VEERGQVVVAVGAAGGDAEEEVDLMADIGERLRERGMREGDEVERGMRERDEVEKVVGGVRFCQSRTLFQPRLFLHTAGAPFSSLVIHTLDGEYRSTLVPAGAAAGAAEEVEGSAAGTLAACCCAARRRAGAMPGMARARQGLGWILDGNIVTQVEAVAMEWLSGAPREETETVAR